MKLELIAEKLNLEVIGNTQIDITQVCSLDEIIPNAVSFCKKNLSYNPLTKSEISVLVCPEKIEVPENKAIIISKNPLSTFVKIIELIRSKVEVSPGISEKTFIADSAKIGKNCNIHPFVSIMDNVIIGDNTTIYPNCTVYPNVTIGSDSIIHSNVTIREDTEIGNRVIIFSNSTIATDGFGYIPDEKEILKMVPQIGKVIIQDDVHIGSNTCIDRGTFGSTLIGKGTKIDNLVQIGHNVKVGKYTIICGTSALAGSSTIGDFCVLGGRTSVSDHVTICDKARIGGISLVASNINSPGDYVGIPATEAKAGMRNLNILKNLAVIIKNIKAEISANKQN